MSGGPGFYRGTTHEQMPFFADKEKKMIESKKWPPEFSRKVDMSKVSLDVLKPWIAKRITDLLGFEDDIVIDFCIQQLSERTDADGDTTEIDPKKLQVNLTGFMAKKTGIFVKELWNLLLSAQDSAGGVPEQFLHEKQAQIAAKQEEVDRIRHELSKVSASDLRSRSAFADFPTLRSSGPGKWDSRSTEPTFTPRLPVIGFGNANPTAFPADLSRYAGEGPPGKVDEMGRRIRGASPRSRSRSERRVGRRRRRESRSASVSPKRRRHSSHSPPAAAARRETRRARRSRSRSRNHRKRSPRNEKEGGRRFKEARGGETENDGAVASSSPAEEPWYTKYAKNREPKPRDERGVPDRHEEERRADDGQRGGPKDSLDEVGEGPAAQHVTAKGGGRRNDASAAGGAADASNRRGVLRGNERRSRRVGGRSVSGGSSRTSSVSSPSSSRHSSPSPDGLKHHNPEVTGGGGGGGGSGGRGRREVEKEERRGRVAEKERKRNNRGRSGRDADGNDSDDDGRRGAAAETVKRPRRSDATKRDRVGRSRVVARSQSADRNSDRGTKRSQQTGNKPVTRRRPGRDDIVIDGMNDDHGKLPAPKTATALKHERASADGGYLRSGRMHADDIEDRVVKRRVQRRQSSAEDSRGAARDGRRQQRANGSTSDLKQFASGAPVNDDGTRSPASTRDPDTDERALPSRNSDGIGNGERPVGGYAYSRSQETQALREKALACVGRAKDRLREPSGSEMVRTETRSSEAASDMRPSDESRSASITYEVEKTVDRREVTEALREKARRALKKNAAPSQYDGGRGGVRGGVGSPDLAGIACSTATGSGSGLSWRDREKTRRL